MNYKFVIILSLYTLTSCSSLRKQVTYSSISGALLGGVVGKELSPNKESDGFNTIIGAASGAVLAGVLGYFLYEDGNPTKGLEPEKVENNTNVLGLSNFFTESELQETSIDSSNVESRPLGNAEADKLRSLGVRPVIPYYKEYQTKKKVILKGDKKIIIPGYKVYEQGVRVE